MVYYNEIDEYAAQWLRNLIDAGHIARGIVDTRSIVDVIPSDLAGFRQCHFFAGVGVWSLALRRAGVPDDADLWTGSCPCQPFSAAGAGAGMDDERHLWPHFHHLIRERRPARVYGEQVASRDAAPWLDLVHTDMEALGYAFGAVAFPSAGVGAPHIRDRTYWVADANSGTGRQRRAHIRGWFDGGDAQSWAGLGSSSSHTDRLGDANDARLERHAGDDSATGWGGASGPTATPSVPRGVDHTGLDHDASQVDTTRGGQPQTDRPANQLGGPGVSFVGLGHADGLGAGRDGRAVSDALSEQDRQHLSVDVDAPSAASGLADANGGQLSWLPILGGDERVGNDTGRAQERGEPQPCGDLCERPRATNGLWRDADWLFCRDGKWRPVEPGTFPLAHGSPARVGRLRAYGNAINVEAARVFIEAVTDPHI